MYKLTIRYTDNTVLIREFKSKKEAYDFAYLEGDHVLMFSVERT